jgi:hypothetical protein
VQKLSDLNYRIVSKTGKEFVVHINRLKKSFNETPWIFEDARRPRKKSRQPGAESSDENVEIQSRPIATSYERLPQVVETHVSWEERTQIDQNTQSPRNAETPAVDSKSRRQPPDSSVQDPDYVPPSSPHSRRELATTPIASPVTRNRARLQLQENIPV